LTPLPLQPFKRRRVKTLPENGSQSAGNLRSVIPYQTVCISIIAPLFFLRGQSVSSYRKLLYTSAILFVFSVALYLIAQVPGAAQSSSATPTPTPVDEQEPVRVFTEEVRIPFLVTDEKGRFDPTIELTDILMLEDNEPQEVRSLRHIPANVLLLLDTAGWNNPAMKTNLTRDIALSLIEKLHAGDQTAVMQFGDRVELLQDWTADTTAVAKILRTKLRSGQRARLKEAITGAAARFQDRPAGSRHVVLITDGVVMTGSGTKTDFYTDYAGALQQLINAQVTVHIVSYTEIGRRAIKNPDAFIKTRSARDRARTAGDVAREAAPAIPGGGGGGGGFAIEFDPAMRRIRKKYIEATKKSERQLASLAETTGGRLWLPTNPDEMITQAREVAREIGAQYVVTYTPKRPLSTAEPGEYRRVKVFLRRPGLNVRSRSGYTVTSAP
jgi:VWFA-related protein